MGQATSVGVAFRRWPALLAVLAPSVLWVAMFAFFPPGGQEFPINDDCLFARTAFAFAHGEGLNYFNWASMPFLGQLLWSWPFVRVLGASQFALRLSTITLAVLGLAGFQDLLRRGYGCAPGRAAAFLTACLGLNPLFFLLACTYQTDVPALAFSLVALALYCRGLRGKGIGWWAGGTFVALLAVSTRQNAVVVPVTAGVFLLRHAELRHRPLWYVGCLAPAAAAVAIHVWFTRRPDVWAQGPVWPPLLRAPVLLLVAIHMVGLTAAPAFALPARGTWKTFLVASAVLFCGVAILRAAGIGIYGPLFPYMGNWLTPWGMFTWTAGAGDRPLLMGPEIRIALTAAGCLAGGALAARGVERFRTGFLHGPLLLFACLHFLLLPIAPAVFDRYLLVLLPAALALVQPTAPIRWPRRVLAGTALALCAAVSFAYLHDLLAWNSARWEVGRRALARGLDPSDVEGGFEWDGWFAPAAAADKHDRPRRGLVQPVAARYFPSVKGRYAISFSAVPNCRVVDSEPYRLWLISGEQHMLLLEAPAETPAATPLPNP